MKLTKLRKIHRPMTEMQNTLKYRDLYEDRPDLIRKETLRPKTALFQINWNDAFGLKEGRIKDEDSKETTSFCSCVLQICGQGGLIFVQY